MKFVKYYPEGSKTLHWGSVDSTTGRVHNHQGGWQYTIDELRESSMIVQEVKAESFDELDWKDTWLTASDDSLCGWVNAAGRYFKCRSQDHLDYAELILHSTEGDLESTGWAKIIRDNAPTDTYLVAVRTRLTVDQRNTILMMGIPLEDDE